jgi:4-aminobutyrate aminotransferase
VAAIFVEPIQGESGYHVPPAGFLPALRKLCDRHGILLVADEVQSGMGRTGKMWAIEHWNVEPDIVCSAKGIASGMPLGAIITRADVMNWPSGSHASTFGGNPVSCRAALATLELLHSGYMKNAAERGEQLKQGLLRLQRQHSFVGEVRGLGLMVAMDLVKERDPYLHDPALRDEIVNAAFHAGLLLLGAGESAIRFCPPLCITAEQVDVALRILGNVLAARRPMPLAV